MATDLQRGFGSVLANRAFRALWTSQALSQTAQNSINFMQMVLIEHITGSSTHLGLMILAFTLPGVVVSPIAGVVVDRLSRKWVLIASNALRVVLTLGYFLVLGRLEGWPLLLAIYIIAFTASAVGQFFSPAEAASIPALVGLHNLVTANSLFNLTLAISQVAGLIILGPLAVKLIGVRGGFVLVAFMYVGATYAVSLIPRDAPRGSSEGRGGWERAASELKEGWSFVLHTRDVALAMSHLTLVATLIMILATLAPGFAARVLGMAPEDAVLVFAPAGVGMLLVTGALGRWGYRLRKDLFSHLALGIASLCFAALGLVSQFLQSHRLRLASPTTGVGTEWLLMVVGLSLVMGATLSAATILAQTIVQEQTPAALRGRVFAVQFMLSNLVGIPPMLTLAGLADWLGIPPILLGVSGFALLATASSAYLRYRRS